MLLNAETHGAIVFHILQQGYHQPFIEGLSNREKIEDEIVKGIYSKELPPMSQQDVDWICDLVDTMIKEYGGKS